MGSKMFSEHAQNLLGGVKGVGIIKPWGKLELYYIIILYILQYYVIILYYIMLYILY